MKKRWNIVWSVFLIFAFVISGCGASSKSADSADMMMKDQATGSYEGGAIEYDMDVMVEEEAEVEDTLAQAEEVAAPNRKLIKRQYLTVETLEFDSFTAMIKSKTESVGGYVENSSVSGNSYYSSRSRYASFTIRVPVEKLEEFVKGIESKCNVTNYSEEVEDITLNYIDTESRIEALKIEQENLMQMLAEASELDTILAIQSRLTEVRYELQSYESQMRSFDNNIEYSTIYLDVYEVERESSKDEGGFGDRLKERLSDNFYNMGNGLEGLALFVLGGLPYWILLAVIAALVILVIKRIIKRKKMKQILKQTNTECVDKKEEHIAETILTKDEK